MQNIEGILDIDKAGVFIAEDDAISRQILEKYLKKESFTIKIFSCGSDLIAAAQKEPPDLILLDIKMPYMDGFATCRTLKNELHLAHIPVIFLTADNSDEAREKGFINGGVDYITKPYNQRELVMRIHTHLRLKKAMDKLTEYNKWLEEQLGRQ